MRRRAIHYTIFTHQSLYYSNMRRSYIIRPYITSSRRPIKAYWFITTLDFIFYFLSTTISYTTTIFTASTSVHFINPCFIFYIFNIVTSIYIVNYYFLFRTFFLQIFAFQSFHIFAHNIDEHSFH